MSSLDQPRVGQTLAVNSFDEAIEPVQRVPFHVAIVQAEGEFVNVAVKVLRAGVMVNAVHPTLHHCPNALNGIRIHIASAVLPCAVIHGIVAEKESANSSVASRFIGHQLGADFDILKHRPVQALFVGVFDGISNRATATLTESYDGSLAYRSATSTKFLGLMFVGFFPAEKGFIGFDYSLQFGEFTAASLAQAVKHEPCRFLLYTDLFGDLHGRHAFASRDEQVHGIEPFVERDVRPLEDSAGAEREIKLALIAAMKASLARRDAILTGTSWAGNAFRPETALKVDSRRFLIGKHLKQFEGADCRTAHLIPFKSC